jgi:hypothetical protein
MQVGPFLKWTLEAQTTPIVMLAKASRVQRVIVVRLILSPSFRSFAAGVNWVNPQLVGVDG